MSFDKRCPNCDLLVEEDRARCRCNFLFWDDTPDHTITAGRLIVTSLLVVIALGSGFALGWGYLGSMRVVRLALLGLVGVSLVGVSRLGFLRKQGGMALSIALFLVLSVTYLISAQLALLEMAQSAKKSKEISTVKTVVYKPGEPLSMDGVVPGREVPNPLPDGLEVDVLYGKVFYVAGGAILQSGATLLKPGDLVDRVKRKFPGYTLKDGLLKLRTGPVIVIESEDGVITELALVSEYRVGSGITVDGVSLGTGRSWARFITRKMKPRPKFFFGVSSHGLEGIIGNSFSGRNGTVKVGDKKSEVPDLKIGFQPLFVTYEENDTIDRVCAGKIHKRILPALVPQSFVNQEKLEFKEQECFNVNRYSQATSWNERWMWAGKNLSVTRELTVPRELKNLQPGSSHAELTKGNLHYSPDGIEVGPTRYQAGEKSVWNFDDDLYECYILQEGNVYKLSLHGKKLKPEDKKRFHTLAKLLAATKQSDPGERR